MARGLARQALRRVGVGGTETSSFTSWLSKIDPDHSSQRRRFWVAGNQESPKAVGCRLARRSGPWAECWVDLVQKGAVCATRPHRTCHFLRATTPGKFEVWRLDFWLLRQPVVQVGECTAGQVRRSHGLPLPFFFSNCHVICADQSVGDADACLKICWNSRPLQARFLDLPNSRNLTL